MTTYSFNIEIDELDRHLLECILQDLEKEYQSDPIHAEAIKLGRKSRYRLLLDKIENSKPNLMSTSSACDFVPPKMWSPKFNND